MHRLAGIGADTRGDEHHPRQQLAARLRRARGQEFAGLFGEIEQDGAAVQHHRVAVDDGRHLGVRVDGEVLGLVLLAFAGIHRDRLVGQTGLLEEQRHLCRIGRAAEIEFEHG